MPTCKECEFFVQEKGRSGTCLKRPYNLRNGNSSQLLKINGEPVKKYVSWSTNACKLFEGKEKSHEFLDEWDRKEVWDAIRCISDIRAKYNLFNPKQRPQYHACSLAIRALREVIDEPIIVEKGGAE